MKVKVSNRYDCHPKTIDYRIRRMIREYLCDGVGACSCATKKCKKIKVLVQVTRNSRHKK